MDFSRPRTPNRFRNQFWFYRSRGIPAKRRASAASVCGEEDFRRGHLSRARRWESQAHMRAALFSFPGWLCLFCASARSASAASTPGSTCTASTAPRSTRTTQEEEEEMASTALDFREMMRKERERAMKKRATAASSSNGTRCFGVDRESRKRCWQSSTAITRGRAEVGFVSHCCGNPHTTVLA